MNSITKEMKIKDKDTIVKYALNDDYKNMNSMIDEMVINFNIHMNEIITELNNSCYYKINRHKEDEKNYREFIKSKYQYNITSVVYLFYNINRELLYIGKSSNFYRRYIKHIYMTNNNNTKEYSNEFEYFKIIPIRDIMCQDLLETYLINYLNPKYNKAKKIKK